MNRRYPYPVKIALSVVVPLLLFAFGASGSPSRQGGGRGAPPPPSASPDADGDDPDEDVDDSVALPEGDDVADDELACDAGIAGGCADPPGGPGASCKRPCDCSAGLYCSKMIPGNCNGNPYGTCQACQGVKTQLDTFHGGGVHVVNACTTGAGVVQCNTALHKPCEGSHTHICYEICQPGNPPTVTAGTQAVVCQGGPPSYSTPCGSAKSCGTMPPAWPPLAPWNQSSGCWLRPGSPCPPGVTYP